MHIPLSSVLASAFIVYSKMSPLTLASVSRARGCCCHLVGPFLALVKSQRQETAQSELSCGLLNRFEELVNMHIADIGLLTCSCQNSCCRHYGGEDSFHKFTSSCA